MKSIVSSKTLAKVKKQIQKKYSKEYINWRLETMGFNLNDNCFK